jgi:hypothetical protein
MDFFFVLSLGASFVSWLSLKREQLVHHKLNVGNKKLILEVQTKSTFLFDSYHANGTFWLRGLGYQLSTLLASSLEQ